MRRTVYVLIVCVFFAGGHGVRGQGALESMVPSETRAFFRTAPVTKLVRSINTFTNTALTPQQKTEFLKDFLQLKKKTGIDILNEKSLRDLGIETSLPVGFAYIDAGKKTGSEGMIVYLPVHNARTFPLKLINILKKADKGKKKDLNPVITPYRNTRIYQVQKTFMGAVGSYYFLTPRGELARRVIDIARSGEKTLASVNNYRTFLEKIDRDADATLYMNRQFLAEAMMGIQKAFMQPKSRRKNRRMRGLNENNQKGYHVIPARYSGGTPYGMRGRHRGPSPLDAVDFASLALKLRSSGLSFSVGAEFNDSNPLFTTLLDILRTDMTGFSLYPPLSYIWGHAAFDLKKLDSLCPGPLPICGQYRQLQMQMKMAAGLDFKKDVLPAIRGSVNVIMDTMNMNDMVIFFPTTSAGSGRALYRKIQRHMRKTMAKKQAYGTARIGGSRCFWILDKGRKKIYFLNNSKGLYVSNNNLSLKKALSYRMVRRAGGNSRLLKKLQNNYFLMAYVKKNPFLSGLMATRAPKKEIKELSSSIGDVYLSGTRKGNYLNIEIDVDVKPAMR